MRDSTHRNVQLAFISVKMKKMSDVNKLLLKAIFLGLIYGFFFLGLGLGVIFVIMGEYSEFYYYDPRFYTGVVSVLFGVLSFLAIIKLILDRFRNPQKFIETRQKGIEGSLGFLRWIYMQDLGAIYVASKKLVLVLPFTTSIFLIGIFTIYAFRSNFFSQVESLLLSNFPPYLQLIGLMYVYSFICISIYMLGYLLTGEILQRMFGQAKRHIIIEMVWNYIYAIPFLLILSLLWVIFALFTSRDKVQNMSIRIWHSLKNLSLYALYEGFKYYAYINLAKISFSDRAMSVYSKESRSLFSKNKIQLLKIYFRAGAIMSLFLIIGLIFFSWNIKFHFLEFLDQNTKVGIYLWFVVSTLLMKLFSEQLAILFYYVKTYHPEDSFEKIGLKLDPDYSPVNKSFFD